MFSVQLTHASESLTLASVPVKAPETTLRHYLRDITPTCAADLYHKAPVHQAAMRGWVPAGGLVDQPAGGHGDQRCCRHHLFDVFKAALASIDIPVTPGSQHHAATPSFEADLLIRSCWMQQLPARQCNYMPIQRMQPGQMKNIRARISTWPLPQGANSLFSLSHRCRTSEET